MKPWIILEGQLDLTILKSLLPDVILAGAEVIVGGGRTNISSIARTVLVKHREPVVVVADADSLDPATIREKAASMEYLIQAVAGRTPFKVILCVPEIEAVFFNAPEILERLFPKWRTVVNLGFVTKSPKDALADLFARGGGPASLSKFLDALTEEEVNRLRTAGPIRDLITFVNEAIEPVSKLTAI